MNRDFKLIALLAAICVTALIFLLPGHLIAFFALHFEHWLGGLPHYQQATIARIGKVAGPWIPMIAAILIAVLGGIVVARRKKRGDSAEL